MIEGKLNPSERILLASDDGAFSNKLYETLLIKGMQCDQAKTGKECQGLLYKNAYWIILLDLELSNFSSLEVLKYIKLSRQSLKVVLFIRDKKLLETFGLDEDKLSRLGILAIVYAAHGPEKIIELINTLSHPTSWKKLTKSDARPEDKECRILDKDLTHVPIRETLAGNIAVFDHFIKLGPNKYVKVVHQSEPFPHAEIQKYAEAGCEYLYFRTKDRAIFINYMNDLSQKLIASKKVPFDRTIHLVKNVTDKYIEEIHTKGIKPELIEEGKKICQNMYNLLDKDVHMTSILKSLENTDASSFSHSFLVSFYAIVISKNVDWVGPKSLETIAIGSLLHDIGKLNFPPTMRARKVIDLNAKEQELYRQHTQMGADMLANISSINEQVRQIVYQHHENVNGTGFPNGLTGLKIYPLAKIVSLANGFSNHLIEKKLPPRQALKAFLQDRETVVKYDPNLVRALVYGLT